VSLSVMQCVCVSAKPRLHAALVSSEKVMHCIQCCLVFIAEVSHYYRKLGSHPLNVISCIILSCTSDVYQP